MANTFPFFQVKGSPREIGTQCGQLFGDRIRACVAFYIELLAEVTRTDISNESSKFVFCEKLREWSIPFEQAIRMHLPHQAQEMEAMAHASQVEPWQIFFINARTELYGIAAQQTKDVTLRTPSECTSLYFKEQQLLGENWDWHPRLEELAIVLEIIRSDGHRITMLAEPGIVGKIGLNSAGVGLCFNILFADVPFEGIPVHCLLREVLECGSAAQARETLERLPRGTTSNLLCADRSGDFFDLELHGQEIRSLKFEDGIVLHTNHYSGEEEQTRTSYPSSFYRYTRAKEIYRVAAQRGLQGFKDLLSDTNIADFPICRSYRQGVSFIVGTVAGVVIDLAKLQLHVIKGQPKVGLEWQIFSA